MDTQIHAYYAHEISTLLEQRYQRNFGASILAYRRQGKSNLNFAAEAFEEIQTRGNADVLAIDIEGFFDNLDHATLKQAWCQILGTERLPQDHFAVFRSVTKDYAILWPTLRTVLRDRHRRRAGKDNAPVCSPKTFRTLIKPLLRPRYQLVAELKKADIAQATPVGIPQGTAISAILANLYMLTIDEHLHRTLKSIGASYRRYSDDILIIAPMDQLPRAEHILKQALAQVKLTINDKKTERVLFRKSFNAGSLTTVRQPNTKSRLRYLGLVFDGRSTRICDATMSRFQIRMARAVKRHAIAARKSDTKKLKRRKLYATMSKLGAGKAYGAWRQDESGQVLPPDKAPRAGFSSYIQRAERIAHGTAIGRQHDQIWNRLHVKLREQAKKLER